MTANNEALALAGRAPMLSRTHPRSPTDIPLAIEQGYIGQSFIREAENGGVPESVEPLFIRIGGEYFHNLLENTWDQYVNTLTKD